jgi:hypothetical protein
MNHQSEEQIDFQMDLHLARLTSQPLPLTGTEAEG